MSSRRPVVSDIQDRLKSYRAERGEWGPLEAFVANPKGSATTLVKALSDPETTPIAAELFSLSDAQRARLARSLQLTEHLHL